MYPPVALPAVAARPSAAQLAAAVARWVSGTPLRDLVTAFGGHWPDGDTGAVLAWLDDFSARHWDFRRGRERSDAAEPDLPSATARRVVQVATALGMVHPNPPVRDTYRYLLVLGGLAHACLHRTGYAAHLLRSGAVTVAEVGVLGSFRVLTPQERDTLAAIGAPGDEFEVDALDAAVRRAFGVVEPVEEAGETADDPRRSWSDRRYRTPDGIGVRVLAAPSGDPAVRRAHTADTQHFWAGRVRLSPGDQVLMVTGSIYVPFQHCDALRTLALPYGAGIDTVGVDAAFNPNRAFTHDPGSRLPPPVLTPGRYLQEIRSAIRSMRALHTAVTHEG